MLGRDFDTVTAPATTAPDTPTTPAPAATAGLARIPAATGTVPACRLLTEPPPNIPAMHIAVIGAGYVGLTTAACFAHLGHDVVCADIDDERVARLNKGEVPILEKGLPELVAEGLASQRLAVRRRRGDGRAPTPRSCSSACRRRRAPTVPPTCRFVEAVAREIAPVLRPGTVVVNKSTVPVGSTRFVQRVLSEAGVAHDDISVASNPEFLREGQAVHDFLNPDRIVIGCEQPVGRGPRARSCTAACRRRCSSPIPRRPR